MVRVSQDEKERSRARILENAARLFRERGIENASVGDVMKAAGMTHGGFYRHFATKDALVEAAMAEAFRQMSMFNRKDGEQTSLPAPSFREFYLSPTHTANPGFGCPAAALAGDVARAPDELKSSFTAGLKAMVANLAATADGTSGDREAQGLRDMAMLVGAVMLARATEPEFADEILAAVRRKPATS